MVLYGFFFRPPAESEAPDFYHPGVAAEQKELAAILFKAIKKLPEQQQAAFVLQKLEGLSGAAIAAVLHVSGSAVESLLHRAKQNLRKLLAEEHQNEGL